MKCPRCSHEMEDLSSAIYRCHNKYCEVGTIQIYFWSKILNGEKE